MIETQPRISIVILNWNGVNDTLECIDSLNKITYKNYEIIVVDNNSEFTDTELLKSKLINEKVILIFNDKNLGFSGGNNVGIKEALTNNSDFILLLNNDTIVESDFLARLVDYASADQKVGIAVPKINYYSEPSRIWYAGGFISKIRGSGYTIGEGATDDKYTKNKFVSFATGCCMLIKKDVINKVGLLDENYFLYLEDTDYSFRAIKSGFNIYYVSKSIIYHKVNAATAKDNSLLPIYYTLRNRLYFARKNLGAYYLFVVVYLLLAFAIKLLFSSNRKNLFNIISRAFKDYHQSRMGYCASV